MKIGFVFSKNARLIAALSTAFLMPAQDATALGVVSRACHLSDLPVGVSNVALRFFYAVGAPSWVLDIPRDQLYKYWVLESLTTDYLRTRYLLYARRHLYVYDGLRGWPPGPTGYGYNYSSTLSSRWSAQEVSDALKADPSFAPYYLNRGILTSSRAGNSEIVETPTWQVSYAYLVIGHHWYFDIKSGASSRLSDTKVNDCNLPNIGLWDR